MVGAVQKSRLDADHRICGQRALHAAFLNAFFHCREVVLGNSAAEYLFLKYIRCLQVTGGLKGHFNVTELSVSAGLLFISSGSLYLFTDGLAERKFRFGKLHFYLITAQKLAYNYLQLLVPNAVKEALAVLRIVDSP